MTGVQRNYAWGSPEAIPEFLGHEPQGVPVAELWFGAHSSASSHLPELGTDLAGHLKDDPSLLGEEARQRFGEDLPFLLKLIAPSAPLSMQVHPNLAQARDGFQRARRGGAGAPVDYVDANHKPELLYTLTEFTALCGFRDTPDALKVLTGITHPVIEEVRSTLAGADGHAGVWTAFRQILEDFPGHDIEDVAGQCVARVAQGSSPCPRTDEIIGTLAEAYPGDRGVVAALLLRPRLLEPGQSMFIPPGVVHMYVEGFGVEIMANSDNVLRAGLTPKNIDVEELLRVVDPGAAAQFPPAIVHSEGVSFFHTPVPDFELGMARAQSGSAVIPSRGPRIVLCISPAARLRVEPTDGSEPGYTRGERTLTLARGQAAFLGNSHGHVHVDEGEILHAGLPLEAPSISGDTTSIRGTT